MRKILIVALMITNTGSARHARPHRIGHTPSAECVRLSKEYSLQMLSLDETLEKMLKAGCI